MQPYAGGHNEPFQGEGALNTIDHNQQQSQPEQSQEQKQRSVIEQYSPELYQFMLQQIVSGRDPIQAGAIAQNDKRFSPIIQKMQKDSNMSWSQIIQKIFGTGAQASYQQMNQQQPQQAQQMQQQAQGQPQGQQAPGQGQQALMAILQEIRSARGK